MNRNIAAILFIICLGFLALAISKTSENRSLHKNWIDSMSTGKTAAAVKSTTTKK